MNTNEDFKAVYEKYLRFSIRIAKKILKDEGLAEDVSQEVFAHLYLIANKIDITNEKKLRALIVTATVNKAKDYLKKRYVKEELLVFEDNELEIEDMKGNPEEMLVQKEKEFCQSAMLRKVLQDLREQNPMNYDILIKTKYLGLSSDDVAQEYGLTRNSVNNRILRTKLWLQGEVLLYKKEHE